MKNKFFKSAILFSIVAVSILSCKKGPGSGGRANITGKVYGITWNQSMTIAQDTGYIGGQNVYLIYGTDAVYSENMKTTYDGTYDFKYLRKGHYKLYTYTRVSQYVDSSIVKEIDVNDKKQTVQVENFNVNK